MRNNVGDIGPELAAAEGATGGTTSAPADGSGGSGNVGAGQSGIGSGGGGIAL